MNCLEMSLPVCRDTDFPRDGKGYRFLKGWKVADTLTFSLPQNELSLNRALLYK